MGARHMGSGRKKLGARLALLSSPMTSLAFLGLSALFLSSPIAASACPVEEARAADKLTEAQAALLKRVEKQVRDAESAVAAVDGFKATPMPTVTARLTDLNRRMQGLEGDLQLQPGRIWLTSSKNIETRLSSWAQAAASVRARARAAAIRKHDVMLAQARQRASAAAKDEKRGRSQRAAGGHGSSACEALDPGWAISFDAKTFRTRVAVHSIPLGNSLVAEVALEFQHPLPNQQAGPTAGAAGGAAQAAPKASGAAPSSAQRGRGGNTAGAPAADPRSMRSLDALLTHAQLLPGVFWKTVAHDSTVKYPNLGAITLVTRLPGDDQDAARKSPQELQHMAARAAAGESENTASGTDEFRITSTFVKERGINASVNFSLRAQIMLTLWASKEFRELIRLATEAPPAAAGGASGSSTNAKPSFKVTGAIASTPITLQGKGLRLVADLMKVIDQVAAQAGAQAPGKQGGSAAVASR